MTWKAVVSRLVEKRSWRKLTALMRVAEGLVRRNSSC